MKIKSSMRLAIVSHKPCFESEDSPGGFKTDGGFPLQVKAITELFAETSLLVPTRKIKVEKKGMTSLSGHCLKVIPLSFSKGEGLFRKLYFPVWLLVNGRKIWREIRRADAVHAPIPGDVGTIGIFIALFLGKPMFVRHCGNWLVQRTIAERFWKWTMEHFAGGQNVMFATGGTGNAPSEKNLEIKWIFSTSLGRDHIESAEVRSFPADGKIRLVTACRLEERKGVDVVIDSLALLKKQFPDATLDIVGGGSLEWSLKEQSKALGLNESVIFHGKVEQTKVVEIMKRSHVFCFPTSASEGFPKVVIEALASGLPVVTTKVSVLPMLIGDRCGVLIEHPTGDEVARAVEGILSDDASYTEYSRSAISTAQQYSLESWRDFIGENLRTAWKVSSLSSG